MIKELNDSVNLLTLVMIECVGWFIHMGQPQHAQDLIIGAIGHYQRQGADFICVYVYIWHQTTRTLSPRREAIMIQAQAAGLPVVRLELDLDNSLGEEML